MMCHCCVNYVGLCLLLALGAIGRRRRPALVTEETNTDPDIGEGQTCVALEPHDPLYYLQDSFGAVKWTQNTAYAGKTP